MIFGRNLLYFFLNELSEILPCHLSSKQVIMKAVSKSENEDKQYIHQSAGLNPVHSEAAWGLWENVCPLSKPMKDYHSKEVDL